MALDRTGLTAGQPSVVVPEAPLPPLPRSLWESREVREAVANDSPGTVVAVARRAHGLRQDELGTLAGFSQSAISRLESGSNIAYDLRVLRPLQRLLGIPAHLLGLADHSLPVGADALDRLVPGFAGVADGTVGVDHNALMTLAAGAVFGGATGGATGGALEEDALHKLLVLRRIIDDAHNWRGPGALMPTARGMYDFVDLLRRSASGEPRRDLLGITAMFAEFYGWLHQGTGDPGGALRWTTRALEQGQAADNRDVVAYSYVRMSQLAEADGDADRMIGLARAARRERGVGPMVRAKALRQEARGLALTGDEVGCMRRLDEASAEFERSEPGGADEYWLGYCNTAEHFRMERAASWLTLGKPGRAIEIYEDIQERVWRRLSRWEQGVHMAKFAYAHAVAGEPEHASSLAYDALETARATGSAQVLRELGRLGSWEGARDVAELARSAR
ncbi:helix-turn-helix domain-containing protein [Saccharothrix deserti]|uniref:helix-turn-helix domain-containing protein n=1 Tax=Saccharothrix deserti TaxID=2593674 RepID=UPI00131D53A0|nr:helix-turn-helix transcriptional regulator [Saccharothrix deserti]